MISIKIPPKWLATQILLLYKSTQHIHLLQFMMANTSKTPDAAYVHLLANRYLPNAGGSILHVLRNGSRFSIKQPWVDAQRALSLSATLLADFVMKWFMTIKFY
ncbi:hypothetical protein O9929_17115 [Vibrio lentus]|nr:hypothetical protein [Vibrio lentus]